VCWSCARRSALVQLIKLCLSSIQQRSTRHKAQPEVSTGCCELSAEGAAYFRKLFEAILTLSALTTNTYQKKRERCLLLYVSSKTWQNYDLSVIEYNQPFKACCLTSRKFEIISTLNKFVTRLTLSGSHFAFSIMKGPARRISTWMACSVKWAGDTVKSLKVVSGLSSAMALEEEQHSIWELHVT